MPIYQVRTELQFAELLALLEYSRRIRSIQTEEAIWDALLDTLVKFYDNVGIFLPINDHQLRLALHFNKDPEVHGKFAANLDKIIIDSQSNPDSLVATCFRTQSTTYFKEPTEAEYAQQNRLVMEFLKPSDILNVPVLSGNKVQMVLACLNTSSGCDSLANVALVEILSHLTSNWYEMYERSLRYALTEQTWKDTTLQILHEAFNSLNQAMWGGRLLGRDVAALSEDQVRYVDALQGNHTVMRRLLNELADFCRLDRGAIPLQLVRYKPEQLLKVVEETVKTLVPEAQARVELCNNLVEPFEVLVDLDRFRQIVTNLVSNAVKYSEEQINVAVDCRRPLFTVTIADHGPGIAPEEQSKIFDPYYRIKNKAPTDPSGWGLGLYITKRLVELHRGELEVQSTPATGTAFTVKFFDAPKAA